MCEKWFPRTTAIMSLLHYIIFFFPRIYLICAFTKVSIDLPSPAATPADRADPCLPCPHFLEPCARP